MHGHDAVIFEARPKAGGLNEYGIAAYKTPEDFAQRELDWLLKIGGIEVRHGQRLGAGLALDALAAEFDAVFLGMGLGGVNALSVPGADKDNVRDAVDFIADLRQAQDLTGLPVGRRVVVIGGGMTAVDAAVQSKLLGAEEVTIVYRRGQDAMPASRYEQDLAQQKGVRLIFNAAPVGVEGNGSLTGVTFAYTEVHDGKLTLTDDTFTVPADQLLKAIGQTLEGGPEALRLERGKIAVDATGRSSRAGVWAGGDCATGGDDLTVTAVAEGRDAAENIHASLMGAK
jgi:glutamate synthase (NADPH/NADH) small chain